MNCSILYKAASSLVRLSAVPPSRPAQVLRRRAQRPSRLALFSATEGLALTAASTMAACDVPGAALRGARSSV